ncbi:hypothetical protein INR49_012795 [Caranx melampygus]|nr:hypothetical protein INR49_012795 [Caranx melampygus]
MPADYGTNATMAYDYSGYYNYEDLPSPCDNMDLQNFSQVFLPILYSLVFIFGFIGRWTVRKLNLG